MPAKRLLIGLTASAALTATTASGCGSALSLPSDLSSAVSSAASQAASVLAEVKGAVDSKSDVQAGAVLTGPTGRTISQLTVTNPTSSPHDYTVSVSFEGSGGNLLDVVVVSIPSVPAHGTSTATAQSNAPLDGAATAKITAALRH